MAHILAFLSANLLPLILLLIGCGLIILEMFIPGFGLPGISGIAVTVFGIVIMADTVLQGLLIALAVIAVLCVAFSIAIHSTANGKIARSKLVLNSVATDASRENALEYYRDKVGAAVTPLSPVGIGEFEGIRLNVLSDGEFIDAGERVKVVKVEGKRIYVRKNA